MKSFEGFSSAPYYDLAGVKTLGYGMTGSAIKGLSSVTEQQAAEMLKKLLNDSYAQPLKTSLDNKKVVLNQNQFDALVSFAYNVGIGGLLGSTLYKNVCAGIRDVATITANFCVWCHTGSEVVAGLLRRRQAEAKMFFGSGNKSEGEEETMDHAVVYFTVNDFSIAKVVADKLGGCAMFCRNASNTNIHADAKSAKHLVVIGGAEVTDHPNVTNCCGFDAPETAIKAAQYAQTL